jgi:hypothetical protein
MLCGELCSQCKMVAHHSSSTLPWLACPPLRSSAACTRCATPRPLACLSLKMEALKFSKMSGPKPFYQEHCVTSLKTSVLSTITVRPSDLQVYWWIIYFLWAFCVEMLCSLVRGYRHISLYIHNSQDHYVFIALLCKEQTSKSLRAPYNCTFGSWGLHIICMGKDCLEERCPNCGSWFLLGFTECLTGFFYATFNVTAVYIWIPVVETGYLLWAVSLRCVCSSYMNCR